MQTTTLYKELRLKEEISIDKIAAELSISVEDYVAIENGQLKINYKQAGILGDLFNIDPTLLIQISGSINYNIGTYSRTIYAEKYVESDEKER